MTAYGSPRDLRGEIEAALYSFLDERRDALPDAAPLVDEIVRVLSAGGKRLRPAFCYWGYRAAGGEHSGEIVRAAAALELLHTFAVIHDDIMDHARERRGVPSTYARHGASIALLAGDLALVLADAALLTSGFPPPALLRGFEPYSRMRQEVIAGQYLDLTAAGSRTGDEELARRIALLKSGLYSVQEPLVIGASLALAPASLLEGLGAFGRPLGEAFQLRDDLLGTFGAPELVGKPVDSDIREGKRTVLFAKTVAAIDGDERDFFVARWGAGDDLAPDEVERLRALIVSSGAREATEELVASLVREALAVLAHVEIDETARRALEDLVVETTDRTG